MRLCALAFLLLAAVFGVCSAGQAPSHGFAVSELSPAIDQYSPPVPPGVEVGPIPPLPHLSRAFRHRWPNVLSATVSPNRKAVAFYTGSRVYLANAQGRRVRRLRVLFPNDIVNQDTLVSFAFRPDSRRVAILTTVVGGEPIGFTIERLWTAPVSTGHVRQLRKWEYRVQGSDPVVADRKIEKWTKNGSAIIITSNVYGGQEMPVDARVVAKKKMIVCDAPILQRRR